MALSPLYKAIYEVVCCIPRGRVTTYGAIAHYLGLSSARIVGWALNALKDNSMLYKVPAHRVVNRHGFLTGKHAFPTPTMMEELLKNEGVEVKDGKIQNFERYFWDPHSLRMEK